MIQVQNGRFHLNWLGYGKGLYPSYPQLRPEFDKLWERFRGFLATEGLGEPRENQWEVTYLNHIPQVTLWKKPADLAKVFMGGILRTPNSGPSLDLDGLGCEWHYEILPRQGRLHVRMQHGRGRVSEEGKETDREIIQITMTARGPIKNYEQSGATLGEGLDLGRETIVRMFESMTSPEAQNYWGKKT